MVSSRRVAKGEDTVIASTLVTPDQDAIVSEIFIAAPPERVFQALIDPGQVRQWWTSKECPIESFAFDAKLGGRWSYDTRHGAITVNGVSTFHCEGEVLEFDPPSRLAYSWIANWHDQPSQPTVVRWELFTSAKGTRVRITHSGLAELPKARKDYSSGWPGVVDCLRSFVEKQAAA
jgi:uncharacterized protein YndB with AHSA1/START domain